MLTSIITNFRWQFGLFKTNTDPIQCAVYHAKTLDTWLMHFTVHETYSIWCIEKLQKGAIWNWAQHWESFRDVNSRWSAIIVYPSPLESLLISFCCMAFSAGNLMIIYDFEFVHQQYSLKSVSFSVFESCFLLSWCFFSFCPLLSCLHFRYLWSMGYNSEDFCK